MAMTTLLNKRLKLSGPLRYLVWVLVAALFLGVLGVTVGVFQTKRKAQQLLRVMQAIKPGYTTLAEAQRLTEQFRGKRWTEGDCAGGECRIEMWLDNLWLSRIRLATPTALSASVSIREGRVVGLGVVLKTWRGDYDWFGVLVAEDGCYPCYPDQKPYKVTLKVDELGRPWETLVDLTAGSTPSQRQQAYQLNLNCLTKIGSCKDSREMLPSVWQDGKVSGWRVRVK